MARVVPLFDQAAPTAAAQTARGLKLLRLRLRAFKGIKEFDLSAGGANVNVYGDNAVGKTTLFDAFTWLLFDKDSANRKDFEIKTLDAQGQALHGLEHTVEAVLEVNGKPLVLRKTFKELWIKARGSAERTFSGHTTDHFVDDVPVAKREYDARIASIMDEKVFKLLTSSTHFNEQLHWQERRKLLLEICGDISDPDVIASDDKLAPLTEILGSRTLEDHRKVLAARRSKINKELEQIPVRISEVQRGMPDVEGLDAAAAEKQLVEARAQRKEKVEQLARIEQGGAAAEKRSRLTEIDARLLEIETAHRRRNEQAYSAKLRAVQDAKAAVDRVEWELGNAGDKRDDAEDRAGQLEGELHKLRQAFRVVSDEEFTYAEESACPTCGQALPDEMVEAARAKALEQWNVARAERLEQINREGRDLRARQSKANAAAEDARRKISTLEADLTSLRKAAAAAQSELDKAGPAATAVGASDEPEYKRLQAEHGLLSAEIRRLQAGGEAETAGLREEIAQLERAVAAAEQVIAQVGQHVRGTARITELEAEEKRLAAEYERLERELFLCDSFVRTKVRLLEDRINSRFEHARFKLFDVQVNGALSECCETLFGGVPYGSGLNRGARLNVGLDIINTLSDHFGFAAPVWIDNAEAVTALIPVKAQLIRLVVSEPDKSLRVEVS